MADHPKFTDTLPEGMPDAAALIEELRSTGDETNRHIIIERYPVLEVLAPVPVLGQWLGMNAQSIYMARTRKRPDGEPTWPAEDDTILGVKMWRFSTVALHRATAPGRGWNLRKAGK